MKKLLYILVLAVFLLTACGKETEEKKEPTKTEQTENKEDSTESSEAKDDSQSVADAPNGDEIQEPSSQAESNTNQSDKNESNGSTNNTAKPNNGSNNNTTTKPSNSGSTGSSNNSSSNNTGSNSRNITTTPSEPVHEHTWTEVTEDEIHYYAWRTLCGKCKTDMTDMTDDEAVYHSAIICRSGYSTHYIEVDFVTENVVKTPIVVGYKCSCGAEKK